MCKAVLFVEALASISTCISSNKVVSYGRIFVWTARCKGVCSPNLLLPSISTCWSSRKVKSSISYCRQRGEKMWRRRGPYIRCWCRRPREVKAWLLPYYSNYDIVANDIEECIRSDRKCFGSIPRSSSIITAFARFFLAALWRAVVPDEPSVSMSHPQFINRWGASGCSPSR